jgi:hypothetical protein
LFTKIISNEKFKSVEQRVQVGGVGARASLPCFLYPSRPAKYKLEKAIKELLSDKQTKYSEIQFAEFMDDYKSKGSDGKPAQPHFKRA